jgi:hypothetical protein
MIEAIFLALRSGLAHGLTAIVGSTIAVGLGGAGLLYMIRKRSTKT